MKYVLYGLPCAGKTTVLNGVVISVLHGRAGLDRLAVGNFNILTDDRKNEMRKQYAAELITREDTFISDGHYCFLDDVVFTDNDGAAYDVFLYLYTEPAIIKERLMVSEKNARYKDISEERIRKWQLSEIEGLRKECHSRNKDFYVVSDIISEDFQAFINKIENGYSSYKLAETIVQKIRAIYPEPCDLHICDGDKTIIVQDSFRICTDNYVTHVFDGDFYTGYQSLKFTEETREMKYDLTKLGALNLNSMVMDKIEGHNTVVITSGIPALWEHIGKRFKLNNIISNTMISADTKYYVVKLLQSYGYRITAYGDSKNDLYMLKQADEGFLCISERISRSLKDVDTSGIKLLCSKSPVILSQIRDDLSEDIAVCKSTSGINGSRLAIAHLKLGEQLGRYIQTVLPNADTAILVLERGGRFFGDGIYMGFGGVFYSYNPKKEDVPKIAQSRVLLVDSVVNTGKSVLEIIRKLKDENADTEIYIAANVVQERVIGMLSDYKLFTIRVSQNSYVGARQSEQKGGKGPDTADRLFNYIS